MLSEVDPTLASLVLALSLEAAKEAGSVITKDLWQQVKRLLGWSDEVPDAEITEAEVARRLLANPTTAHRIAGLLRQRQAAETVQSNTIRAEKVVVSQAITTVNM